MIFNVDNANLSGRRLTDRGGLHATAEFYDCLDPIVGGEVRIGIHRQHFHPD